MLGDIERRDAAERGAAKAYEEMQRLATSTKPINIIDELKNFLHKKFPDKEFARSEKKSIDDRMVSLVIEELILKFIEQLLRDCDAKKER